MNGCFLFPTFCYLFHKLLGINCEDAKRKILNSCRHCNQGYESLPSDDADSSSKRYLKCILTTTSETLGFIMQLSALVSIPVLLSINYFYEPSGKGKHHITATYFLIPVSLGIISFVWSGWIQKIIIRYSGSKTAKELMYKRKGSEVADLENTCELPSGDDKTARFKAGKYIYACFYYNCDISTGNLI